MTAVREVSAEFGVLGPLTATVDGSAVPLGSPKTRIVLASLLMRPNRLVSVEQLVDRLWGDDPPKGARSTAQTYVMRLRTALGDAGSLVRTLTSGYRIEVTPEMVDLGRFHHRIAVAQAARSTSDAQAEAAELRDALAIWRGTPLVDVPSELLHNHDVQQLTEERLHALERLMDVELELGRHAEVIGELRTLTEENRLRERFWGQLMLALHRSDRQAEALNVYRKVSALLRDELGIDPGKALQELNQRLLRSNQAPATPRPPKTTAERVPFELPADIPDFAGRAELLTQIRELTTRPRPNSLAVPVAILSGPPGAGKTALAIHAAHRLRAEFPGGQLYVNLRGYSTSPPLAATDALARFLRALGVDPDQIPHEVDEQSAMLRSLLSGRKVFMVLDNASSPEHVRPLLPSDPSCAVLITSRNNLNGLTALSGARRLPVGMVSADEARAMVANIVGADRVDAEPAAAAELAAACGFLPLGLRIASTNLAASSSRSIAEYVLRLHPGGRLDAMEIEGDDQAAVRPAFDMSYSTLKPALSRFFRVLSLIPGPDFDSRAGAAVAGVDLVEAQRLLDQLAATNLIGSIAPGRFQFHDLIKEFATECVEGQESADERGEALRRLFSFYLQWTNSACRQLFPNAHFTVSPISGSTASAPTWEDSADALNWLDTEEDNLVAVVGATTLVELPVWELADTMLPYLQRGRRDSTWNMSSNWKSLCTEALSAAEQFGGPGAQASMHRGLGMLHFDQSRYVEAEPHLVQAVRLYHAAGEAAGEARAHAVLASCLFELGAVEKAVDYLEESLRLTSDTGVQNVMLTNLGMTWIHLGLTDQGVETVKQAADLDSRYDQERCAMAYAFKDMWLGRLNSALHGFGKVVDAWSEPRFTMGLTDAVHDIAVTSLDAQRPDVALDLGTRALAWAREAGSSWLTIGCHVVIGEAMLAMDDVVKAMRHFEDARSLAPKGMSYWSTETARGLAACCRRSGRLPEALTYASEGLADPLPRGQARGHTELARVRLAQGDHRSALEHAEEGHRIADVYGYRLDRTRALRVKADAHAAAGDLATAQELHEQVTAVFDAVRLETNDVLVELVARVPAVDE